MALCLVFLMLTGCAAKTPEEMYSVLLMPAGVEYGMNSLDVGAIVGVDVDELGDAGMSEFQADMSVKLGHYCVFTDAFYAFIKGEYAEFDDTHKLARIWMRIEDTIPYSSRTEKKYGDIAAEYENIKAYFTEVYGAPSRDRQGLNYHGNGRDAKWDDVNGGFLILTLENITTKNSTGRISVEYRDNEIFDSEDWYIT